MTRPWFSAKKDDAVWFASRFFYWLGDRCYRLAYKIEWGARRAANSHE